MFGTGFQAQAGDITAFSPASIGIFYSTRIGEEKKVRGKPQGHKFVRGHEQIVALFRKLLLIILGLSQIYPMSHQTPH
jgi:hypothetical protein